MYITVRSGQSKPGTAKEVVRVINEHYLPIVSKIPGFVAYYAIDDGTDRVTTISIFDSQAGAEESTRASQQVVRDHLAALLDGKVDVLAGEVVVQR